MTEEARTPAFTPEPEKSLSTRKRVLIGAGAAVLAIAVASVATSCSQKSGDTTSQPGATSTTDNKDEEPEPVKDDDSFSGDGMYAVGSEVQPGLYRSDGTGYWERLSSASGDFDAILANGNPVGQIYVQIQKSDKLFSTTGMNDWVAVDENATGPKSTSFGDGMYAVGTDIKAGTYKSSGGGYWERLSSAKGGFDAILANGNPTGSAIVEISSGDAFFSTSGNGQWKRVG